MKKIHNTGVWIIQIAFIFWILETVSFLIIEGWHIKATSDAEILMDKISLIILRIGFLMWVISAADIVRKEYAD